MLYLLWLSYHAQIIKYILHANFTQSFYKLIWLLQISQILCTYTINRHSKSIFEVENILANPILTSYPEEYINLIKKNMRFINTANGTNILTIIIVMLICIGISTSRTNLLNDAEPPCDINNNFCFIGFFIFNSTIYLSTGIAFIIGECIFFKWTMICNSLLEILQLNLKNMDYENGALSIQLLKLNIFRHKKILK